MKKYFVDEENEEEQNSGDKFRRGRRNLGRKIPREIDELQYQSSESEQPERLSEEEQSSFSVCSPTHEDNDFDDGLN